MLDRLIPGRMKASVRVSLENLHELARAELARQEMRKQTAVLWEGMCECTFEIMSQLIVKNTDRRLEWGLRSNRHKLDDTRLAVLYWWFLMYQFVLFKHKGAEGFTRDEELAQLHEASERFIEHLASSSNFNFQVPGPWEERWRHQVSLEASLGLYNRTMGMLGMHVDLDQRVLRVSFFTSATENIYDSIISRRAEGET